MYLSSFVNPHDALYFYVYVCEYNFIFYFFVKSCGFYYFLLKESILCIKSSVNYIFCYFYGVFGLFVFVI